MESDIQSGHSVWRIQPSHLTAQRWMAVEPGYLSATRVVWATRSWSCSLSCGTRRAKNTHPAVVLLGVKEHGPRTRPRGALPSHRTAPPPRIFLGFVGEQLPDGPRARCTPRAAFSTLRSGRAKGHNGRGMSPHRLRLLPRTVAGRRHRRVLWHVWGACLASSFPSSHPDGRGSSQACAGHAKAYHTLRSSPPAASSPRSS